MSDRRSMRQGRVAAALTRALLVRLLVTTIATGALVPAARVAAQQCPTLPGNGFAFLPVNPPSDTCPVIPRVRWPEQRVVFDCDFFGDPNHEINCGPGGTSSCVERCRQAAATWNTDLPGRFTFDPADGSVVVNFCDRDDGRTSVGGSHEVCDGTALGSNVLAVTLRLTIVSGPQAGRLLDSDITVNQAFTFSADGFRSTVGHEFGHVLGLDHPDQCDRDFNVIMRSSSLFSSNEACFVVEPTADDVAGAQMIYAITGPTCGDADGDGGVTVADGVQVLRETLELPSSCTVAVCDVDGNGTIDLVDGVNVLRRAASLPATITCGGAP